MSTRAQSSRARVAREESEIKNEKIEFSSETFYMTFRFLVSLLFSSLTNNANDAQHKRGRLKIETLFVFDFDIQFYLGLGSKPKIGQQHTRLPLKEESY